MHIAARNGHANIIRILAEAGADVSCIDEEVVECNT